MTAKRVLHSLLPPLLWNFGRAWRRRLFTSADHLAYAPDGWKTRLPGGADRDAYWTALLDRERAGYARLVARVQAGDPVLETGSVDVNHLVFGYALLLAARGQARVSVLDYGGNLGENYWLGRALAPGLDLEFHCKELPAVAESGRAVNPAVTFHTDDRCFDRRYDMVLFSSSTQYLPEWQTILGVAARASSHCLLLSEVATVRQAPAFVATSRSAGITTLQIQLNRDDVVNAVQAEGLRLIRELPLGPHPPIANALEQPSRVSFLFQRG